MSVEQRSDADQAPGADVSETGTRSMRPSLQSLLLEMGVASEDELRHAFAEGQLRGLRLGEVALARGWLDEEGLARLLARQWGLPFLARESLGLDPTAAGLLSPEQTRSLGGCVIGRSDGGPLVVVAEPTVERMSALESALGPSAHFAVVTEQSLQKLLEQRDRVGSVPAPPPEDADTETPPVEAGQPAARTDEADTEDDGQTEALVADLELATAGLTTARERIEQLAAARRGAEQLVADLHERVAGLERERAQAEERASDVQAELEAERARFSAFRSQLSGLLAELES